MTWELTGTCPTCSAPIYATEEKDSPPTCHYTCPCHVDLLDRLKAEANAIWVQARGPGVRSGEELP